MKLYFFKYQNRKGEDLNTIATAYAIAESEDEAAKILLAGFPNTEGTDQRNFEALVDLADYIDVEVFDLNFPLLISRVLF